MNRIQTSVAALALCLAAACGSSDSSGPSVSPTPGDVDIVRGASLLTTTAFDPNPKTVSLGGAADVTVRWVNRDGGGAYGGTSVTHQIASDNGAFTNSAPLGSNATYTATFTQAGTYHYHCAIHPNMVGTITVSP
jgi:plastocyanin